MTGRRDALKGSEGSNKPMEAVKRANVGTTGHQVSHMPYPDSDSMPMRIGSDSKGLPKKHREQF